MPHPTIVRAIAAAAAMLSLPAAAQPHADVSATWHPDRGPQGQYCVKASFVETAAMTGTRIYQRACRSPAEWRRMGVSFTHLPRRAALR